MFRSRIKFVAIFIGLSMGLCLGNPLLAQSEKSPVDKPSIVECLWEQALEFLERAGIVETIGPEFSPGGVTAQPVDPKRGGNGSSTSKSKKS